MKIKVLRIADEGFKNYNQNHIKSNDTIEGCYCFVDKIIEDRLLYNFSFRHEVERLNLKDRTAEKENEMLIDKDTLVYTENFMITGINDVTEVVYNEDKDYCDSDDESYDEFDEYGKEYPEWILELQTEPIIKGCSEESYVLVPISKVFDRIKKYEELMDNEDYEICNPSFLGPTEGSVHEIILDINNIK